MGEVLLAARRSQFMPEFMASLPLAAMDGTLRDRFISGGMPGHLRLKTGRLDHVTAIAGYVNARSGRNYVVVVLQNYKDVHRGLGEEVQDALLRWVFSH